jgi:hypothetical protein
MSMVGKMLAHYEITSRLSKGGKRFLMMGEAGVVTSAGEAPWKINIVLNWIEELKQRKR